MRPRSGLYLGRWVACLLLATASLSRVADAEREDEKQTSEQQLDDVDHVQLAARLIKDGHYDRAAKELAKVDPKQEGVDLPRFHTLRGLVYLEQDKYRQARDAFQSAVANGQKDPVVFLHLAQVHYGLKDYNGVIGSLRKAGKAGDDVPGTYMMRSQAHWELGQHAQAIAALNQGQARFPEKTEFTRIKIFYLIDLGLFQEVARVGKQYLARGNVSAEDFAAVAEGLRQSKQHDQAINLLETARLKFSGDEKLTVLLAHSYMDAGHPHIAAMLFEEAARLNPKYSLEAAELYMDSGRFPRALTLNQRISDQKAKIKQRLSILLKMEHYERIAAMADRLERLGLLTDDKVRYALAYSHFKTNEFAEAEKHLRHISDQKLFNNATQLRKAMENCRQAGWECM